MRRNSGIARAILMLKFLFGGANPRTAINKKVLDLEAKLSPVVGGSGRGEIEFTAWRDGAKQLDIELRGMSGSSAEVFIDGERITTVLLENGRADVFLDTCKGNAVPSFTQGAQVEIRQHNDLILGGVLLPD